MPCVRKQQSTSSYTQSPTATTCSLTLLPVAPSHFSHTYPWQWQLSIAQLGLQQDANVLQVLFYCCVRLCVILCDV